MKRILMAGFLVLIAGGPSLAQEWITEESTPKKKIQSELELQKKKAGYYEVEVLELNNGFKPIPKESVQVMTWLPSVAYIELGLMKVEGKSNADMNKFLGALKWRAADIGADAIVGLKIEDNPERTRFSFKGPIPYKVISCKAIKIK